MNEIPIVDLDHPRLCRTCGAPMRAATNTALATRKPKEGDISLCMECGEISVFDADGHIVEPSPEEYDKLAADPEIASWRMRVISR